nr:MAG TPA: peptidyl-prolyl cis-transisomerase [Caudoviricetes sp.]DAV17376.1 MAG TPA: peptidyl-prolyl cis-transisomerase [Caudoviricetes sp.]
MYITKYSEKAEPKNSAFLVSLAVDFNHPH